MKISEVIERLKKIKEEEGDLPVYSHLSGESMEREIQQSSFDILEAEKAGWAGVVYYPKSPKRLSI